MNTFLSIQLTDHNISIIFICFAFLFALLVMYWDHKQSKARTIKSKHLSGVISVICLLCAILSAWICLIYAI